MVRLNPHFSIIAKIEKKCFMVRNEISGVKTICDLCAIYIR